LAGSEAAAAAEAGLKMHAWLDQRAAEVAPGAQGLVLLPYFLGEKTPLQDPHARGTVVGLGLHHTLAHLWRAALEGIVFGLRHHIEVFAERGLGIARIFACDGGAASDLWLQIATDVLARPVQRIDRHPGSCLGAAYVAGYGVGLLKELTGIARYVAAGRLFQPDRQTPRGSHCAHSNYPTAYPELKKLH